MRTTPCFRIIVAMPSVTPLAATRIVSFRPVAADYSSILTMSAVSRINAFAERVIRDLNPRKRSAFRVVSYAVIGRER